MELLRQTYHIARKKYPCMSYEWICNCCDDFSEMTFTEKRAIVKARNNNGMILKGQKYLYQFIVDSGDKYVFKAIPELHEICLKYKIYPED